MATQLLLEIPDDVRAYAEAVARSTNRSIESVLLSGLRAALGGLEGVALDQISQLQDEQLWAVIRQPLAWSVAARLDELKQHLNASENELAEIERLVDLYDQWVLLRSEALRVLTSRGHHVTEAIESVP